ncbi:RING-H2 finger protein ATL2-like [Cicer arietinum]|uniref:RING-type E3 ubiquitin transferase n=1 Tax=Cicer arietinum TaxID=3827 RepID=A0A1S2XDX1_CICAR|nr:RING-H2 finger protein ATL2-like [Cicer arietinum]
MVKDEEPSNKFNQENSVNDFDAKGYSLSGKVMLCAIIILFFVVVLMFCLHIYARWYLLRSRRRRRLLRRRTQLVFFTDSPTTSVSVVTSSGLDAAVIASLPLFFYDPNTHPENAAECAVCLSEFEPGESGRVLPKCDHAFHTECIDMWFHSHSTCPLCRAPVEPTPDSQTRPEIVLKICEPETGSSSSSVGLRRKPSFVGVTVDVPVRDESCIDSPSSTQSSFRSPMSRMMSLKRILSREWKGSVSPSSCGGSGGGCSSVVELKVEQGGRDETVS